MARKKETQVRAPKFNLSPETKKDILVVFVFLIAFLSILGLFNLSGAFGRAIQGLWQTIFGNAAPFWPFILIIIGYLIINLEKYEIKVSRWLGLFLFILTSTGLLQIFSSDKTFTAAKLGQGGGLLGYLTAMPLEKIAGFWGALIILMALFLISLLLFFETSFQNILNKFHLPGADFILRMREKIRERREEKKLESFRAEEIGFEQKEIADIDTKTLKHENTKTQEERVEFESNGEQKEMFPTVRKHYPKIDIPLDLLTGKISEPTAGDIKGNQETIRRTLSHFGIEVEMGEVSVGPTVTQYTLKPASGIKLSQITTLANDLALALAAHPIRIEAPIPGKSLVGVEVPNLKIALVPLKEIIASKEFKNRESNLMVALGKDVAGKPWLANLEKTLHILVAGATGSGKTVCLNSIIVSLLFQNQPDELKFILIDPKRVELPQYNGIPHLSCPVITDPKKTVQALRWAAKEMDRRFDILSHTGHRNIAEYNAVHKEEKMPYLILVVDELAHLMVVAAAEVETAVIRLSQMARAVGIHLILATQRPSVDVITGLIKANITSRLAFSVASMVDSRTILDYSGAEKLLGKGDMLFISPEISKPKRLQGAYVASEEIERVVKYLKQQGVPDYDDEITLVPETTGVDNYNYQSAEEDELLPEAEELIKRIGKGSASYLQRRLRIGYSRAARLLDSLEKRGLVGPAEGSKPRELLVKGGPIEEWRNGSEEEEMGSENVNDEEMSGGEGEKNSNQ